MAVTEPPRNPHRSSPNAAPRRSRSMAPFATSRSSFASLPPSPLLRSKILGSARSPRTRVPLPRCLRLCLAPTVAGSPMDPTGLRGAIDPRCIEGRQRPQPRPRVPPPRRRRLNHIYGLSITGLHFFTVYGRPDMAYFSFARSIVAGEPIMQFRAPTAPTRAATSPTLMMLLGPLGLPRHARHGRQEHGSKSGKKRGPAPLRVYNLGNTSSVPITRMVAILEKILGKKARKHVVTMPSNGDVPFTHANVSHAARYFDYRPTTSLEAGLRHFVVDWFVWYYTPARPPRGMSAAS